MRKGPKIPRGKPPGKGPKHSTRNSGLSSKCLQRSGSIGIKLKEYMQGTLEESENWVMASMVEKEISWVSSQATMEQSEE